MKYLFFDTETTGFPPKARLVSIAWQIWDEKNLIEKDYYVVKPNGFEIPYQAEKVHGISTKFALENGEDLQKVIDIFNVKLNEVDAVVAHNYGFDSKIIFGEYKRLNANDNLSFKQSIDTMTESTNYLKLPGNYGKYKWPKLEELYLHLFGENFGNAHSADADVDATVKCFFELKKLGIL
ncbi:MAG: 3'-5' exonuclease [Bacteroidota bacterium]|nr:3'-5' exonuclease [Bacteroidota bacterium]